MKKILFILLSLLSSYTFSQAVSFSGPVSESLNFTVPEGVKGFLISVEYSDQNSDIIIKDLISPHNQKIIGSNFGTPAAIRIPSKVDTVFQSKVRMTYVTKGKFAALVNETSDLKTAGTWALRLANQNKNIKDSSVFVNIKYLLHSDDKELSLNIDINADINNSSISKAQLTNTIDSVAAFFAQYDITVNFNVKDSWRDPYVETPDLEKKIELLQSGKKENLQVYILKRQSSIERELQGVAGCFPIVIIEKTHQHCSVIVAYEDQESVSADKMTKVITHEVLHGLGLFHLSDNFFPFGTKFDDMTDTQEDTDLTNVMHKKSDFFGSIEMSPQQAEAVKSNIILQTDRLKSIYLSN